LQACCPMRHGACGQASWRLHAAHSASYQCHRATAGGAHPIAGHWRGTRGTRASCRRGGAHSRAGRARLCAGPAPSSRRVGACLSAAAPPGEERTQGEQGERRGSPGRAARCAGRGEGAVAVVLVVHVGRRIDALMRPVADIPGRAVVDRAAAIPALRGGDVARIRPAVPRLALALADLAVVAVGAPVAVVAGRAGQQLTGARRLGTEAGNVRADRASVAGAAVAGRVAAEMRVMRSGMAVSAS
jgi:hypothetical protein